MMDLISILPGRARFRSYKVYRNKFLARSIHAYMEGLYGVKYGSINPNTGSILIVFDVEKTNHELLVNHIEAAIASEKFASKEILQRHELYFKTIEKRDCVKRNFLSFGMLYLFLKLKHATVGKFSISRNIALLEIASAVTIIGGYPLLKRFYKNCSKNMPTDADLLLKLTATAFTLLRESTKGVFVLILKYLSDYIKYAAEVECMRTLNDSMGKTSGMAWLLLPDHQEVLVPVDGLKIGDLVVVHKGEVSGVEGEIISGRAVLNSLYHSGQPIVTHVGKGNKVHEGSTVVFGDVTVKIERLPALVSKNDLSYEHLNIYKRVGVYQNKVTKIAMGAAGLNYILTGNMLNALSVLLVLTPSATATALSDGMKNYVATLKSHNIYLRNTNTFEKIASTDVMMFDKTGTLTYGNMRINHIESFSETYSSRELLKICAACEVDHYHPISITLKDYADEDYDVSKVQSSVLIPSQGIEAVYDNHQLLIGNIKLFENKNINLTSGMRQYRHFEQQFYYPLFIAIDNELAGIISMEDEVRKHADLLFYKLRTKGIHDIRLLTGDIYEKALHTADQLGIEKVYGECSYEDKLSIVTE
ncbi:MAG: cation-translocating P-type ATPase, partial [Vallitaleaceae bacterium]|nr:cation-translocating P-type ATPase [Vallitaleaceae bacterium]